MSKDKFVLPPSSFDSASARGCGSSSSFSSMFIAEVNSLTRSSTVLVGGSPFSPNDLQTLHKSFFRFFCLNSYHNRSLCQWTTATALPSALPVWISAEESRALPTATGPRASPPLWNIQTATIWPGTNSLKIILLTIPEYCFFRNIP